ncbi:MAG: Lin0512 family protein, partial [Pseudomonadota bacterium]
MAEAAARAIRDALWRNALSAAELFGFDREDMIVDVEIGAPRPERVDAAALAGVLSEVLSDGGRRAAMAEAGRRRVLALEAWRGRAAERTATLQGRGPSALADLFLERPILSAPIAARALGLT